MIRKFKSFGLAVVAVFAMSAIVATMAQATAGTLTTEGKTVTATAEQVGEHEFTLTDHEIEPAKFFSFKCKKAIFTGTAGVTDGATSMTVHPVYSECTIFGGPVTITTTGCDYLLKTGTPTATGGWHATTDIVCAAGSVIKIVSGTCEIQVGAQTGLATSEVTNSGGEKTAMDLLIHTKITGLVYNVTKDPIGCFLKGTGVKSKGDYTGTTTVKAHESVSGAAVGITLH
jgi:hypothetical protein